MNETVDLVLRYLSKAYRYRVFGYAAALTLAALGWYAVHLIPDSFVSTARILVPQSTLDSLLKGIALDDQHLERGFLTIAQDSLLSRSAIIQIIEESDSNAIGMDETALEALILSVRSRLEIKSNIQAARQGQPQTLSLSFRDEDPEFAFRILNAALNAFFESALVTSQLDSSTTADFLEAQISAYELRLEESEERLESFKRSNVGFMPADGVTYFHQIQTLRTEIADAELLLAQAERRRDTLRQQTGGVTSLSNSNDPAELAVVRTKMERLSELENTRSELLVRYTERHPEVLSVNEQLERLRAELNETDASAIVLQQGNINSELLIELSVAEAEVSSLRARLEEYNKRETELKSMVDVLPQIEAELSKLNRDYDIYKKRYEELVDRRETARISQEAERAGDQTRFTVIEPPRVPLFASEPNRLLLNAGILLVAVGTGIALTLAISFLSNTYSDAKELAESFDIPVLGSLTHSGIERSAISRLDIALFLFFVTSLAAGFLGAVRFL